MHKLGNLNVLYYIMGDRVGPTSDETKTSEGLIISSFRK